MKSVSVNSVILAACILFPTGCRQQFSDLSENSAPKAGKVSSSKVIVFGWASAASEDKESESQARARQCLLLAGGAFFEMSGGDLSIKKHAELLGLKFSPLRNVKDFVVTELSAQVSTVIPLGYTPIGGITQTVPLTTFLGSIAEEAQRCLNSQQPLKSETKGFLILKSMELKSTGQDVKCRYELEFYRDQK